MYEASSEGRSLRHSWCDLKRKQCSFAGCTNQSMKGGVCWTHGAKLEVKRCSHKGCKNCVVKGGVCKTHGAIVIKKRCKFWEDVQIKPLREEFVSHMVPR